MQHGMTIGQVSKRTGLTADTLRYYEKVGLLENVQRSGRGIRLYSEANIGSLEFVKRAQKMNFSLAEIAELLKLRHNPSEADGSTRRMAQEKLIAIDAQLEAINLLRQELSSMVERSEGHSSTVVKGGFGAA